MSKEGEVMLRIAMSEEDGGLEKDLRSALLCRKIDRAIGEIKALTWSIVMSLTSHLHLPSSMECRQLGSGLISDEGFTMLMSPGGAVSVWKTLLSEGAVSMGSEACEKLRVIQGRPAPERELSKVFNVLEAGLWNSTSLNKGTRKALGQETIARLTTYDGNKQRLCGLEFFAQAEPDSTITIDGKKVGKLTSYTRGRNRSSQFRVRVHQETSSLDWKHSDYRGHLWDCS
ncbi:hypothetical protein Bca52824_003502 [Brassica carinata]|uniref:Uncharacterized protein n=1 Tax=Brassica carinata TaxID=52824 RepID=A0A8X8BFV6_BRACI|nr:hypothetical protein Bca52824_003502 [Brassica carinata]